MIKIWTTFLLLVLVLCPFREADVSAAEQDCLGCHKKLTAGKVQHAAVMMGCSTCHLSPHEKEKPVLSLMADPPGLCFNCHDKKIVSGKVQHSAVKAGMCTSCHNPHSSENKKLLNAQPPDLCYTCHDKGMFMKKHQHSAVAAGMCTSCHNPHASENEMALVSQPPELCYTCHDKGMFTKKNVHGPVGSGMCTHCHSPHATDNIFALMQPINDLCVTCHTEDNIRNGMHVVRGFRSAGHPVKGKKDPSRKGRRFACTGCHDPHSSDWQKLYRYQARSTFALCQYCHKK